MAAELESEIERLEGELSLALVERDPADEKDVIVEIATASGTLTTHRLDQILGGDLDELTKALQAEDWRLGLEAASA